MRPVFHIVILVAVGILVGCSTQGWNDAPHSPAPEKKVKVFILAGQSNMEGRANGDLISPQDRVRLEKAQDRVQLAFNQEGIRPLDVSKPDPEIAEIYKLDVHFGPELFFGMAMAEAWPEEQIILIKLAAGSTSLYGAWNPEWRKEYAAVMGEENDPRLYEALTTYVAQVLSGYEQDEYELCAMLWVQGETDSGNKTAAAAYGDNLSHLVERIRRDTKRDDLPFLVFQVGRGQVVEGMKRVDQEVPGVSLISQSQDLDSRYFYEKIANGHYNHEGLKKLGQRFAALYLSLD